MSSLRRNLHRQHGHGPDPVHHQHVEQEQQGQGAHAEVRAGDVQPGINHVAFQICRQAGIVLIGMYTVVHCTVLLAHKSHASRIGFSR